MITAREKLEQLLTPLGYKLFEGNWALDFVRVSYTPPTKGLNESVTVWHIVVPIDNFNSHTFSISAVRTSSEKILNWETYECSMRVPNMDVCIEFIEKNMDFYNGLSARKDLMEI